LGVVVVVVVVIMCYVLLLRETLDYDRKEGFGDEFKNE